MDWSEVGAAIAALVGGLLAWWNHRKRAQAEQKLQAKEVELESTQRHIEGVGANSEAKEARIVELETRLAEDDPGAVFDDVFGRLRRYDD